MWSDNETTTDLLGFPHLVTAVTSIVRQPSVLPATIGVFGDWGSGKSSLLQMVAADLKKDENTLVLSFNGWLFEGYEDAKTALMGTILDGIAEHKNFLPKAQQRMTKLLQRVNWFRILGATAKYGAAFGLAGPLGLGMAAATDAGTVAAAAGEKVRDTTLDEGAKFFKEGTEFRKAVSEFREEFNTLLEETDISTLVVVIDDLDRCLPETIIETLEAIKLFLFTPKTAFILGADERLVKYAVRRRFPELPGESVEVGRDYLEKLIQFPVHIPPLDAGELENFINMLFVGISGLSSEECEKARQKAVGEVSALGNVRFTYGVAKELFNPVPHLLAEGMGLAQRIAPVLTAGLTGNPRQCKRFLNTLVMRLAMATSRKLELKRPILAKLMLLEYFKPEWFKRLAELQAAQEGFPAELSVMEKLCQSNAGAAERSRGMKGDSSEKEEKLAAEFTAWTNDPWTHDWLASEPRVGAVDLRPYFYFSRDTLGPIGGAVRRLSPRAQDLLQKFLHESDGQRLAASNEAKKISPSDAAAVLEALCERVNREDALDLERPPLASVIALAEAVVDLRGQVLSFLSRLPEPRIPVSVPPKMVSLFSEPTLVPAMRQVLERWAAAKTNKLLGKAAQVALQRIK